MSGLLSQTLTNLNTAEKQIVALGGLPPQVRKIQTESEAAISPMILNVQTIQKEVANFVQFALPELNNIKTDQPIALIKGKIAEIKNKANTLKSTVDEMSSQIKSVQSQVIGYFDQLAVVESDLTKMMTTLQAQLDNAECEEKAAKKKYYYLIALGPFGLIGLSVALGLYLKWQSDVNEYESQISSLNVQINIFNSMKSICILMGKDFQEVVTRISDIRNMIDFIIGDILTIDSDLDSGSLLSVVMIKIHAAITEITTMGVDAS